MSDSMGLPYFYVVLHILLEKKGFEMFWGRMFRRIVKPWGGGSGAGKITICTVITFW